MINGLYSRGQVEDYWTDAQVHSRDGKGHGLGNCGIECGKISFWSYLRKFADFDVDIRKILEQKRVVTPCWHL